MAFNKIDGAAALKAAGIELPENWGKLSTSRAEAWTNKALGKADNTVGMISKAVGMISKAVGTITGAVGAVGALSGSMAAAASATAEFTATAASMLGVSEENVRFRPKKEVIPGEVYHNPNWKRRPKGTSRGWFPVRKLAESPEVPSRQTARQWALRSKKMPLYATQAAWHKFNGFGKVGPGRSRRAA